MSYQATKWPKCILSAYCQVKDGSLKRLHTVFFQFYDIPEKAKLQRLKNDLYFLRVLGSWARRNRSSTEEFLGWKTMHGIFMVDT